MTQRANLNIFVKMSCDVSAHDQPSYVAYLLTSEMEESVGTFTGGNLASALNKAALIAQPKARENIISVGLKLEGRPESPKYSYCDTVLAEWNWLQAKQVADYLLENAK